jgi:hypothetical protein
MSGSLPFGVLNATYNANSDQLTVFINWLNADGTLISSTYKGTPAGQSETLLNNTFYYFVNNNFPAQVVINNYVAQWISNYQYLLSCISLFFLDSLSILPNGLSNVIKLKKQLKTLFFPQPPYVASANT